MQALKADGKLTENMSEEEATDLLLTLLSVRNWEQLRITCNWTQDRYIDMMQQLTTQALVKSE